MATWIENRHKKYQDQFPKIELYAKGVPYGEYEHMSELTPSKDWMALGDEEVEGYKGDVIKCLPPAKPGKTERAANTKQPVEKTAKTERTTRK